MVAPFQLRIEVGLLTKVSAMAPNQYCPEDDFLNSSNALQHKELGVILVFFDLKSRRPKTTWWKENRFDAKW